MKIFWNLVHVVSAVCGIYGVGPQANMLRVKPLDLCNNPGMMGLSDSERILMMRSAVLVYKSRV